MSKEQRLSMLKKSMRMMGVYSLLVFVFLALAIFLDPGDWYTFYFSLISSMMIIAPFLTMLSGWIIFEIRRWPIEFKAEEDNVGEGN